MSGFDPLGLGIKFFAFVVCITIHEFSHAFAAYTQGDPTAKQLGRLSLNPIRHLDPLGTLMLFLLAISNFGIGWGKPTPVNPQNLRNGRKSMALVAVAGVTANLLMATLLGLAIRLNLLNGVVAQGYLPPGLSEFSYTLVRTIIGINIGLAVFNLLPVAPLDGFSFVVNVLPRKTSAWFSRYAHWGPGILMLLVFLPQLIPGMHNLNPIARLLNPPFRLLEHLIVGS